MTNTPPPNTPPPTPPDTPTPDTSTPDAAAPAGAAASQAVDRHMLEALVCPVTRGPLSYDAGRQELISRAAHLAYPIRGGIPIMLESEARAID